MNPFQKESFTTYRAWEESFINFMTQQARNPSLRSWQKLAVSEETLEIACCCAIVLANLIAYEFPAQSRNLFQISAQLKTLTTYELNHWLQGGWLNIADIEDSLQAMLVNQ